MNMPSRLGRLALAFAAIGALSACSSGGDDEPPVAPPAASGITLSGVVATGAAMPGAGIAVTCATGTATATSGADGGYSVNLATGVLPCVLQATSSDRATVLRSVAVGTTASTTVAITANVTPLTELLVAQVTGREPGAYVAALNASTLAAQFTPTTVAAAQTALVATLTSAGVDTSTVANFNFVSSPLVAAVGSTTGNEHDRVLDRLRGALSKGGVTLPALTATVASTAAAAQAGSAGTPATDISGVASLPADLMLRSKTSNCAAMASGDFRTIYMAPSVTTGANDVVTAIDTARFDATTSTFTNPRNANDTWSLPIIGPCRFGEGEDDLVVAASGIGVVRAHVGSDDDSVNVSARNSLRLIVLMPVQRFTVAELAGTWNFMGWSPASGVYEVNTFIATFNASGARTQTKCEGSPVGTAESACATVNPALPPQLATHSDGGLTLASTDPANAFSSRIWAYRTGGGEVMLVSLNAQGQMSIGTRYRTQALPAVGRVTSGWNVLADAAARVTDLVSTSLNTVLTVDTAASSYLRSSANNGSTVTQPQTLQVNKPRNGLTRRVGETVLNSNDVSVNNRESTFMDLRGTGLTAIYLANSSTGTTPSNARFGLSVSRP